MNRLGPYREAIALAALAGLVWLLLLPGRHHHQRLGLLFDPAPGYIAVTSDGTTLHFDLDHQPPVLRDSTGQLIGRLWEREARAIREGLTDCQLLTVNTAPSLSAEQREQFGLDHPTTLEAAGRSLQLGSSGLDRGHAIEDGKVLLLDTDLAALIARPAAALRDPSLGINQPQRIVCSAGWQVDFHAGRWWLTAGDEDRQWTDDNVMTLWVDALMADTLIGFAQAPAEPLVRATLTITTADNSLITLDDLGPATGGGRLLRRSQAGSGDQIDEYLISNLDPIFLAPQAQALAPRKFIPLDLKLADHVTIGGHQFIRSGQIWSINDQTDLDQTAVLQWLTELAAVARTTPVANTPAVTVQLDQHTFTSPASTAAIARLIDPERLMSLRLRQVTPNVEADAITALVLQERDGAPTIFNREPGGDWPQHDRRVANAFITALLQATVSRWSPVTDPSTVQDTSHTVTIATTDKTTVLHLDEDGTVYVPHRGLRGVLTARSRRELLGR